MGLREITARWLGRERQSAPPEAVSVRQLPPHSIWTELLCEKLPTLREKVQGLGGGEERVDARSRLETIVEAALRGDDISDRLRALAAELEVSLSSGTRSETSPASAHSGLIARGDHPIIESLPCRALPGPRAPTREGRRLLDQRPSFRPAGGLAVIAFSEALTKRLGEWWPVTLLGVGLPYVAAAWCAWLAGNDHLIDVAYLVQQLSDEFTRHTAGPQSSAAVIVVAALAATGAALAARCLGRVAERTWLGAWPCPLQRLETWLIEGRATRWQDLANQHTAASKLAADTKLECDADRARDLARRRNRHRSGRDGRRICGTGRRSTARAHADREVQNCHHR